MASPRKLALITGASAGLGAAFARAYAQRGFDVALTARNRERLDALADELATAYGVEALAVPADLADDDAPASILRAIAARGRSVAALVNNAGFGIPRRYVDAPWSEHRAFLMALAVAPCALARAVIPDMREQRWGRIINVASVAGFAPGVSGNTLYPAVKSLMIKFSQSLDAEYRADGLRVTALCPGSTRTEFAARAGYQQTAGVRGPFVQSAEEVAAAAIAANEAGRTVAIPGWWNRLSVALMRGLPEPLVRSVIDAGARRFLARIER